MSQLIEVFVFGLKSGTWNCLSLLIFISSGGGLEAVAVDICKSERIRRLGPLLNSVITSRFQIIAKSFIYVLPRGACVGAKVTTFWHHSTSGTSVRCCSAKGKLLLVCSLQLRHMLLRRDYFAAHIWPPHTLWQGCMVAEAEVEWPLGGVSKSILKIHLEGRWIGVLANLMLMMRN